MGTMTLTQFREELSFDLDARPDRTNLPADLPDARLNLWINAAYMHMSLPGVRGVMGRGFIEFQFRHTVTLVSGTNEYSLAKATVGRKVHYPVAVTHHFATTLSPTNRKVKLYPRSYQYLEERTLSSAAPRLWSWFGETLILGSVPGVAENNQLLRVSYQGEPDRLAADGDTTVLGDYFDFVLRKGALWVAQMSLGDIARAEATKQEYAVLLNEGIVADMGTLDDTGWESGVETGDSPMGAGT